jgi:hypothetical protein
MKSLSFTLVVLVFFLVSCAPSDDIIQTALAETMDAAPTITETPEPTNTLTLTPSPSNTPSQTPSETPTYTPSETSTATNTFTPTPDVRIITIDSKAFLLEKEDLPKNAKYYLPGPNWISPILNEEIVQSWGSEEGRDYLDKTGRIEGWWVFYKRGNTTLLVPEEIMHNVVMYENLEGALLTITELARDTRDVEYKKLNREIEIGGTSLAYLKKKMQPNGKYKVWYMVETAYRNYVSIVQGYGWEEEVKYEYVEDIARTAIMKLEAAPIEMP